MYRRLSLPLLALSILALPFSCHGHEDEVRASGAKTNTQTGQDKSQKAGSTAGESSKAASRADTKGQAGGTEAGKDPKLGEGKATSKPAEKDASSAFSRFIETGKLAGRFETSIVSFKDPKGRVVDLIAAVHIADTAYYKGLQTKMESYDALLYELVAAKGTVPEKGRKSASIISQFQRFLKTSLNLDFQLDAIEYKRKNFVHADLSPEEFKKKQAERGESLVSLMLNSVIQGMKDEKEGKGSKVTILHILAGFFAKDQARYHKFLFAQELTRMEAMLSAFGDAKGAESTIIGDRNTACFDVLDEQIKEGKKKIGIFYGAAHLPDMEVRLIKMGFKKTGTVWLTAWDLEK